MTTYFHFAVKSTSEAYDYHLILGKAHFTIGYAGFTNASNEVYPVLGNMKRDGEWYSYDIPISEFKKITTNLWAGMQSKFKDNIFCAEVGGTKGNELHIDNMFFWKNKADGINTPVAPAVNNRNLGIFDLTGSKVQNMSKSGLYIIRTADSVKKVFVK